MTRRFFALAVILAGGLGLLIVTTPEVRDLHAQPKTPDEAAPAVKVERDVHYDTIEKEKLYLDLAMPKDGGPYPCVVMFHGGAWVGGSRKDLSSNGKTKDGKAVPSVIEEVASRGYVVASVSYRLAPKHQFPAQIQDARAAVRFLRAKSKDYNILRDKFAAAGFSAGGHISLLLGLADKVDGWDVGENKDHSSRVQCVVDFFGPADLSLYSTSKGLEDAYMVPVFGKEVKTNKEIYKKASPINYVTKDAPPVILFHGTFDLIVPVIHSENLHKKLQDAGVTSELNTLFGEGHGWNGRAMAKSTNQALAFLETHLKGKK